MSRDTIRARVDAATEGPWTWDEDPDLTQDSVWANDGDMVATTYGSVAKGSTDAADAAFIAHAREDIPALLAVADAAAAIAPFLLAYRRALGEVHVNPDVVLGDVERLSEALAALEALP